MLPILLSPQPLKIPLFTEFFNLSCRQPTPTYMKKSFQNIVLNSVFQCFQSKRCNSHVFCYKDDKSFQHCFRQCFPMFPVKHTVEILRISSLQSLSTSDKMKGPKTGLPGETTFDPRKASTPSPKSMPISGTKNKLSGHSKVLLRPGLAQVAWLRLASPRPRQASKRPNSSGVEIPPSTPNGALWSDFTLTQQRRPCSYCVWPHHLYCWLTLPT